MEHGQHSRYEVVMAQLNKKKRIGLLLCLSAFAPWRSGPRDELVRAARRRPTRLISVGT
jgi:hypothetical protein